MHLNPKNNLKTLAKVIIGTNHQAESSQRLIECCQKFRRPFKNHLERQDFAPVRPRVHLAGSGRSPFIFPASPLARRITSLAVRPEAFENNGITCSIPAIYGNALLRIDAHGPHERVLMRWHRAVHAIRSELISPLLPVGEGLLLGIALAEKRRRRADSAEVATAED